MSISSALLLPLLLPAAAAQDQVTVLEGVTVIDVEAGDARADQRVVVRGEAIDTIGKSGAALPEGARVIAADGLFLVPGLVDSHVHYSGSVDTYGPLMIANGVTLARDTGSETASILALREELNSGARLGPELICTGAIVDGDPPVWPFSEACDTEEEVRAAVRKLHAAGVDQIKVYSRLEPDVYAAAVDEAHVLGLQAIGHVPNGLSIMDAVAAGQDGVEHLSGFELAIAAHAPDAEPPTAGGEWASFGWWYKYAEADLEGLRGAFADIAEAGMVHCPTLVVMVGMGKAADPELRDEALLAYVPSYLHGFWNSETYAGFGRSTFAAIPHMRALVGELYRAGVPLITGTDLTNPYTIAGFSLHDELEEFQSAGIPPAAALRAATLGPAEFFGVAERLGSIAPGKTASMFLTRANPLDDVRNAREIEGVFLRGEYFDRDALDALLDGVRRQVGGAPLAAGSAEDAPPAAGPTQERGELVAEGKLRIRFAAFDAGHESFRIHKQDDGYTIHVENRPRGGPDTPFVLDLEYDADRRFRSGTFRQLVDSPVEASYQVADATVRARASQGDAIFDPTEVELAEGAVLDPAVFAAAFFTLAGLELGVGESRELTSLGFGRPDWRPQPTPMVVTRHDDEAVPGRDDATPAHRYTSIYTTPGGAFEQRIWTDADGVVLRAEFEIPMGMVEATLE